MTCSLCGLNDCHCDYDPRLAAAARAPEAYISGYMTGWRIGQLVAQLSGLTFAPHPFQQASPAWAMTTMLLHEMTPMVRREMPYIQQFNIDCDEL